MESLTFRPLLAVSIKFKNRSSRHMFTQLEVVQSFDEFVTVILLTIRYVAQFVRSVSRAVSFVSRVIAAIINDF